MLARGAEASLPTRTVAILLDAFSRRQLVAGTPLFQEGSPVTGVWIVRSGSVELATSSGSRRRVVEIHRSGDIVGDLYVIADVPAPVTARSLNPGEAWYADAGTFRSLLAGHPPLAVAWLRNVCARALEARDRTLDLVGGSLAERLAHLLLEESSGGRVELPQKTVAQLLGVRRTSLNRVLKRLEHEGAVSVSYRTIVLEDRRTLERLADRSA